MRNCFRSCLLTIIFMLAAAHTVFAAGWVKGTGENQNRWWYELEKGMYYAGTAQQPNWQWIDGNGDGIAECYAFDQSGWMYADSLTPDGYQVNGDGAWIEYGVVQTKPVQNDNSIAVNQMRVNIESGGHTIVFELNNSPAAREFYGQLPLLAEVQNFGGIEKLFYLPQRLNISDTPLANAGNGTLAYYAPWGNVAIYYGYNGTDAGLYDLGRAVSGTEFISSMTGTVEISKAQ